jgi:methylenetetrahydrofolate--tRNA-(uracil-5-)-methyltransferase
MTKPPAYARSQTRNAGPEEFSMKKVAVVGAGLAGSEAAWILADKYRLDVILFEMKRQTPTPAQSEPQHFAELVCSNSLKSKSRLNPAGLLKTEMKAMGSLTIAAAAQSEVPAGEALAVDRELFSGFITRALQNHPKINTVDACINSVNDVFGYGVDVVIIATGPLTASDLADDLRRLTDSESLYFYDAIAPIIDGDSIDHSIAFFANRKTKTAARDAQLKDMQQSFAEDGSAEQGHYLNLPLNREEYFNFVEAVKQGEKVPFHDFEEPRFFNGCQPIEVLAESGPMTLAFGPMKPIGLDDPRTGRRPFAAVQLRREKLGDNSYNMVGFQTRLKWPEQKRIFKLLPALANAEFHRMGSMHRNTYLVAPKLIQSHDLSMKFNSNVWLAGQISGVEGYVESAATGLLIGHVVGHKLTRTAALELPPADTAIGCLVAHLRDSDPARYCPMNIHWGLFTAPTDEDLSKSEARYPELQNPKSCKKLDKGLKRSILADRSENLFADWLKRTEL